MAAPLPTPLGVNNRGVQFTGDRASTVPPNVIDPNLVLFLKMLLDVVKEQREQIEVLRVAVNETRADPTTVFPDIPAF